MLLKSIFKLFDGDLCEWFETARTQAKYLCAISKAGLSAAGVPTTLMRLVVLKDEPVCVVGALSYSPYLQTITCDIK